MKLEGYKFMYDHFYIETEPYNATMYMYVATSSVAIQTTVLYCSHVPSHSHW